MYVPITANLPISQSGALCLPLLNRDVAAEKEYSENFREAGGGATWLMVLYR
jgi:hypothetical protein